MATDKAGSVERPPFISKDDPRRFTIRTGAVTATKALNGDGQEEMWLTGVASSSVADRMDDVLDETCQARMLDQAHGLTMWLNHSYLVPEDILGTSLSPSLRMATDPDQGDCLDLEIRVLIDPENPRAVKTWRHSKRGTKLGFSIGGKFLDVELRDPDDWGSGLLVHDIALFEISVVGIPANQRAMVSDMTRGFKSSIADVSKSLKTASSPVDLPQLVCKSLLGGTRPEEIRLNTKATGTREDANDDESGNTVPENPNATPTPDRPPTPSDSPTAGRHPAVGPPNADEPPAVPQIGTPAVTGEGQPKESNPVSPANAAPYPARFHGDDENNGHQGGPEHLPSRQEQHAEQGVHDAHSGAEVTADVMADRDKSPSVSNETHATETDMDAEKSLKDMDSDDASPVLPDGPAGDKMRRQVIKSMRAMKRAAAPGMHKESIMHLKKAHMAMKGLLGPDFDLPEDAMLDEVDDTAQRSLPNPTQKSALLDAEITRKQTEIANLERKLADLTATPTGRRSANPGGSTQNDSEPLVSPDMYYKSNHDQALAVSRAVRDERVGSSARDRAV